jgi:hypothetical protein
MQTQTTTSIEQALSLADAINQLVSSYEADALESNNLVDELSKSEQENTFLKLQLSNMKKRLDEVIEQNDQLVEARKRDEAKEKDFNKKAQMVSDNANQHMQMLEQANREKAQIEMKLNDALLTLASYKLFGSPKKIREQRKDYQLRISKHLKAEVQHKYEIKKYRHAIAFAEKEVEEISTRLREIDMTEAYNQKGEHLWLFPKVMQIQSRGMTDKEIVLLYMNDDGRGALMSIDDDGELVMGKAPVRPKSSTKDHAAMLLRKFKSNGWTVHTDDLAVIGG